MPPPAPMELQQYRLCTVNRESTQLNAFEMWPPSEPKLAYYSSMGSLHNKLKVDQFKTITQVLIIVHGSSRSADDYLCCGISAVPRELKNTTLVLAPWFLAPEDDVPSELVDQLLQWEEDGPIPHTWRYGAEAMNAPTISSYEAMDLLVEAIMFDKERFPSLEKIVVGGHSAGGQFTHRWALTSKSNIWGSDAQQYDEERLLPLRVVAANPRSFCYLDDRRYTNGTFGKPDSDRIRQCPEYNAWEWGLEMGGRVPIPQFFQAELERQGMTAITERYAKRDVVYLAGNLDVLPVHSECEDDSFQGNYRFQRSELYFESLQEFYGRPTHRRLIADQVPHDHCLIFQSVAGQRALFGDDSIKDQDDEPSMESLYWSWSENHQLLLMG